MSLNFCVAGLSPQFIEDAVQSLISKFLPLNPKDLDSWQNDPEEWLSAEDRDEEQWEFELRVRR